jgi:enoyl-CoA hydratase/carnithine racemase
VAETTYGDVNVNLGDDFVATVELQRAPDNYFDRKLVSDIADALEALDREAACRVVVLCSAGKNFCAGANLRARTLADDGGRHLYDEAARLFATKKPIVAAIQGAAIGGGLGLALAADFRVAAPEARFSANFAKLGFHPGFALSVTLPEVVGSQAALELLYTGRRVDGESALAMGLCDRVAPLASLRAEARAFASAIAASGPLAIEAIRATQRGGLVSRVRAAMNHERIEQERLQHTQDFREGVRAMAERREPKFTRS